MFIRNKEGRVPVTVHLEDIAGKLEETMDHWEQYLNVVTGVFEALPDGMYIEADERRPYRRFKDELNYHGLTETYYAFRSLEFMKIAKEWCEDNGIPFRTRKK